MRSRASLGSSVSPTSQARCGTANGGDTPLVRPQRLPSCGAEPSQFIAVRLIRMHRPSS
jgi:hypothetical protein